MGQRPCSSGANIHLALGVCPSNRRGRVPGLAGADARRRDAGDVVAHRRVAPTKQMSPPGRNPKGAWALHDDRSRCSSSTMRNDIASSSRLALPVQAPCARPLLLLGQTPRLRVPGLSTICTCKPETSTNPNDSLRQWKACEYRGLGSIGGTIFSDRARIPGKYSLQASKPIEAAPAER